MQLCMFHFPSFKEYTLAFSMLSAKFQQYTSIPAADKELCVMERRTNPPPDICKTDKAASIV